MHSGKDKNRTRKILFTLLVLFVLASSIIGFTFSPAINNSSGGSGEFKYNGVKVYQAENGLFAEVAGKAIGFTYFPEELGETETGSIASAISSARVVYLTSDAGSAEASSISAAEFDISRALESTKNSFVEVAFTGENDFGKSAVTCADASPSVPVLFFNFTNSTSGLSESSGCFVINFESGRALAKARDKIVYQLIGAIK